MIRIIYLIVGSVSLGLGILGIFLPVLPTTPFLLLTTYCYAYGSEKFYDWFTNTEIYKKHLQSFVKNRSMTLKTKLTILLFASCMLLFSLILIESIIMKIVILLLYIYKYYYFFNYIKTIKE